MDGKIDMVREALERLRGFTHHAADNQDAEDIKTVCAALSAIDPEAIKREARAEALQPIRVIRDGIVEIGLNNIDQEKLLAELAAILGVEPAQDDGKPDVVMTMIENDDLTISWECSVCKKLIDDKEDIETVEKCPHCGAPISDFLYIEEDEE